MHVRVSLQPTRCDWQELLREWPTSWTTGGSTTATSPASPWHWIPFSSPKCSRSLSPMTADRSLIARLAAHEWWAKTTDSTARTEPARRALLDRFEREVDPDGVLPSHERARRAAHACKAYFTRLALRSAHVVRPPKVPGEPMRVQPSRQASYQRERVTLRSSERQHSADSPENLNQDSTERCDLHPRRTTAARDTSPLRPRWQRAVRAGSSAPTGLPSGGEEDRLLHPHRDGAARASRRGPRKPSRSKTSRGYRAALRRSRRPDVRTSGRPDVRAEMITRRCWPTTPRSPLLS